MKIPSNPIWREGFYYELIQQCLASRQDRKSEYARLRAYFLYGAGTDSQPAQYNKIYPHLDQLTSFLFAADTTRFSIELGAEVDRKLMQPRMGPLVQRLNDRWADSNTDIVFSNCVTWALVFNTMLVKLVQRGRETHAFAVEPQNFGVLREDVTMLDRQEAFVHVFYTTRAQLERDLNKHPNRATIMVRLSATPKHDNDMPAGVQRIITSSFYPTMQGIVYAPLDAMDMYKPKTTEPLVEMYELWLWNDDAHDGKGDWQVVTMADPSVTIYDRASGEGMFMAGEQPFTQVCPNPQYDYFWGTSEVQRLTALQDMREHRMKIVGELLDRASNPPKALQGNWQGIMDEKDFALQRIGALISSQDPTAKVNEFKPQIPTDTWAEIREIDQMFSEMSAMSNVLSGRGETGVRSKGQTDALARLGSSRPKKRALIIEDSLERIATQYMKLDQLHNKEKLNTDEGVVFIAEQFTKDFMVKVDAHSSSPVFMEDQKNLAFDLFDRGIIGGDSVLDIVKPQEVQLLKERWKKIEAAKAAQAKAQQELEQAKVENKGPRLASG